MFHAITYQALNRPHKVAFPVLHMAMAFVLAVLLLGHGVAHAEVAAQAEFIHGDVTAERGSDGSRALAQGGDVYDQDTIRTAAAARAQLRFTDGALVSLMPETIFSVQEYRLDADGADGSLVFNLLSGGLRTVTGAIGKTRHEAYELKTPVGTLGIRGTEYTAVLNPPGTLRVHVGRGKVVLSNDHGELLVGQGESAVMTLGQGPELSDQAPDATGLAGAVPATGAMAMDDPAMNPDPMGLELPLPSLDELGTNIGSVDLPGVGDSPGGGSISLPPCDENNQDYC